MATPALARETYRPDKEVADVEDPPFRPQLVEDAPIARARVPTKDLTVHVQLDDGWHRMSPDGTETACGRHIDIRFQLGERNGRAVEHPLARCECWTEREWQKADANFRSKWSRDYDGPRRSP